MQTTRRDTHICFYQTVGMTGQTRTSAHDPTIVQHADRLKSQMYELYLSKMLTFLLNYPQPPERETRANHFIIYELQTAAQHFQLINQSINPAAWRLVCVCVHTSC